MEPKQFVVSFKCMAFVAVSDTLFTTDAAAGKMKLIHDHLGILYDSFGITCIGVTSQPITPEQVSQNVKKVHEYVRRCASRPTKGHG